MKRFFRLVACAAALVAFVGVAKAQQQGGERYLLINAMFKVNMNKLVEYKANMDRCHEAAIQTDGVISYDYYQLCTDPSQILVFERFKSEEALAKHFQADYFVQMNTTRQEQAHLDTSFKSSNVRVMVDGEPKGERLLLNIIRKVKPEHVSTFRDSFLKCRVETLKEEGCDAYELYQSPSDPTIFFIFEIWKSEQAHKLHSTLPHLKTHSEETRGVGDPDFKGEFVRVFIE